MSSNPTRLARSLKLPDLNQPLPLPQRRQHWLDQHHKIAWGNVPPPPTNIKSEVIDEREEYGLVTRNVLLSWSPGAKLKVRLIIPAKAAKEDAKLPVYMTQMTHEGWAEIAARRGYVGCMVSACDGDDDAEDWIKLYPDVTWKRIRRRAWALSRALDYLNTVPEVDSSKVAITGHSRNGKTVLIAAACDQRFAAVIPSSSGTGGVAPWRLATEASSCEGINALLGSYPAWFAPNLLPYAGREWDLPIESNQLVAAVAPRACLISVASNDTADILINSEQSYLSAKIIYDELGASNQLALIQRFGQHDTLPKDHELTLDWLDGVFERGPRVASSPLVHPTQKNQYEDAQGLVSAIVSNDQFEELRKRVFDLPIPTGMRNYGHLYPYRIHLHTRESEMPEVTRTDLSFGGAVPAEFYLPRGAGNAPTLIFLAHPQRSAGYSGVSTSVPMRHFNTLVMAGFPVLAFDPIGFGPRVFDEADYLRRFPNSTLLDQRIRDTIAAISAAQKLRPAPIVLVGFNLGANLAAITAAIDNRVAGIVLIGGETHRHTALISKLASRPKYTADFGEDLPSEVIKLTGPERCTRIELEPAITWLRSIKWQKKLTTFSNAASLN